MKVTEAKLSNEYIRGLIEGEGCFTFCSVAFGGNKKLLPAFVLAMSSQDEDLIKKVRDSLGLRNKVYSYKARERKDGYKRQGMAMFLVRDVGQIKNIIVPLFYKKLNGYKAKQFELWMERIKSDPLVPESYKFIYRIYKSGFYDKGKFE